MGSLWPDFARKPKEPGASNVFLEHFDRHQQIDRITDTHEILEPVRQALRPTFRKTTPIIIDMMLDHFLAIHWERYHVTELPIFAQACYQHMADFSELPIPDRLNKTRYWMRKHDWFVYYQSEAGILDAMDGMARRIRFNNPISEHKHVAIESIPKFTDELHGFIELLNQTYQKG